MNGLTWFGLISVTAMMLCYAAERRSPIYILGFAAACMMGSTYGFLQGAWPFGIVEAVWSIYAVRRWWLQPRMNDHRAGRLNIEVNASRIGMEMQHDQSGS